MPKNYTLKAETGKFEGKVGGLEHKPGEGEINVLLFLLVKDLINALQASNDFMTRVAFHTDTKGYIEQTINVEILNRMIKANEDALSRVGVNT